MKKLMVAIVAMALMVGCAIPAFATTPAGNMGGYMKVETFCGGCSQDRVHSCMRSLCERIQLAMQNIESPAAVQPSSNDAAQSDASAQSTQSVQPNATQTTPQPGARGYCEGYVDADGDGLCDRHGTYCPYNGNDNGSYNGGGYCPRYDNSNGYGSGNSNGYGSGNGYGYGNGSGAGGYHHGGHHGAHCAR